MNADATLKVKFLELSNDSVLICRALKFFMFCISGALNNLQTLKVDDNHLVELPDSIGR